MSESYSVFVRKAICFPEIKATLEEITNVPLERTESTDWEIYSAQLLGFSIALLEASDYEDDGELEFSRYSYQIHVELIPKAFEIRYESDWRLMGTLIIGSMVSRKLNCECIAVRNMDTLLERFLPDEIEDGPL